MTADEILTMPPGNEMNAAVHSLVFGREVRWTRGLPFAVGDVGLLGTNAVPYYSTEIVKAWLVMDWLRERWGRFNLTAGMAWHCGYNSLEQRCGHGDTPMLAICRAALLEATKSAEE